MSSKKWLILGFAFLPASLTFGQYFTPVSTILETKTWGSLGNPPGGTVQGPDDYKDFGSQTGTVQASSSLAAYAVPPTAADGSVTIDPVGGTINVSLTATSQSGAPFPTQGLASTTIIFNVAPGYGMNLGLNTAYPHTDDDPYNNVSSTITGPDGFSFAASLGDFTVQTIPSVPAGQYTLTCTAMTNEIAGTEAQFPGDNVTTITLFPEPTGLIFAAGIFGLIPMRRRRG